VSWPAKAAAREEALLFARDLATGNLMNDRDWFGLMVAIADDNGQSVDSIPIAKVDTE
jgi:hypothetical protein